MSVSAREARWRAAPGAAARPAERVVAPAVHVVVRSIAQESGGRRSTPSATDASLATATGARGRWWCCRRVRGPAFSPSRTPPAARTAQAWRSPAHLADAGGVSRRRGHVDVGGGALPICPLALAPQHTTEPSMRSAQVKAAPAERGGVAQAGDGDGRRESRLAPGRSWLLDPVPQQTRSHGEARRRGSRRRPPRRCP